MNKKLTLISGISVFALFCSVLFSVPLKNTVAAEEIDGSKEKYIAAKSGLNLRSDPGKSSKIVTLIPFGSKVSVEKSDGNEIFLDGRYGKWVNIKFGDKTGWVFSGFLCDFEPDTVIKIVNNYYKEQCKKSYGALKFGDKEYCAFLFENNKVFIKDILDNYIVIEVPVFPAGETPANDVVWRYDAKKKRIFKVYDELSRGPKYLFYLDNDKYPDLVVGGSCCSSMAVDFYLGSENGFTKVADFAGWEDHSYYTFGLCGDTEIACSERNDNYETEEIKYTPVFYYRFNCDKRKFEKYAESKMVYLAGVVKSVDWGNMSVVIKNKEDGKDTSYKFSNKYKFYDKTHYFGEHIESLKKNLRTGKDVSISYVVINGEKMIEYIDLKR